MRRFTWIAACSCALVIACKGSGPSCTELTEHIINATMAAMPAHAGMKLANKQQMTDHCEKDMSADERRCMMDAPDLAAFGKCRSQFHGPLPAPAPAPAAPSPAAPSPAAPSPAPPTPSSGTGAPP
jgi:hypothetical protein